MTAAITLVISGSLSERAIRRFLDSPAAQGCVVVEFDTMLEQARYPRVARWLSYTSFVSSAEEAQALNDRARTLLAALLQPCPELGELPGDDQIRRAALRARDWQVAVPRLLNDQIFTQLRLQHEIGRILVAAGSGISFSGWRRTAAEAGVPVDFLRVERSPMSLSRRLVRWRARWLRKRKEAAQKQQETPRPPTLGRADVLCCSERVGSIFTAETGTPKFTLKQVETDHLGEPTEDELRPWADHYQSWWQSWQARHLGDPAAGSEPTALQKFQDILLALGTAYVPGRYARFAALRERARRVLEAERPQMLLSDTQTDTEDRVWSLAAAALGIPVISFTYDHFVDSKLSFVPDHLLSDGACSLHAAINHGYPSEHIVMVRSHRKPQEQRRTEAEVLHHLQQTRPRLLFADSYHAAWSAHSDPRLWLTQYQQLAQVARLLPGVDLFIKPHPLRTPKQELLAFAGMDEQELHVRKRFLRSLPSPPNLHLLAPEENMLRCLESTAMLLNTNSTTGLQAFHLGMPVIFLSRPDNLFHSYPQIHEHMEVLCCTDGAALADHISRLLGQPELVLAQVREQRRYLDDYYWHSPKTLAEGVADILSAHPTEPPA